MKKGLVVVVLSCCLVVACKKKVNTNFGHSVQPPKGLDTLISMKSKINGQAWGTDSVLAYLAKSTSDSTKMSLMVTATLKQTSAPTTITFTVSNYTGINTYVIDPPYVSGTYYVGNARHFASAGQVVISSDDSFGIIGAFNLTADSFNITEGAFNAAHP